MNFFLFYVNTFTSWTVALFHHHSTMLKTFHCYGQRKINKNCLPTQAKYTNQVISDAEAFHMYCEFLQSYPNLKSLPCFDIGNAYFFISGSTHTIYKMSFPNYEMEILLDNF